MAYTHETGTVIKSYNSQKEHCFYEETTKRQMFLIIQQLSNLVKGDHNDWVDIAVEERELLIINGIK